jgi:hypothetical protein
VAAGAGLVAPAAGWAAGTSVGASAGVVAVSAALSAGNAPAVAVGTTGPTALPAGAGTVTVTIVVVPVIGTVGACSVAAPGTGVSGLDVTSGCPAGTSVAVWAGTGVLVGAFGAGVCVGLAGRGVLLGAGAAVAAPGVGVRVGTVGFPCPGAAHRSEAPDNPKDRMTKNPAR